MITVTYIFAAMLLALGAITLIGFFKDLGE